MAKNNLDGVGTKAVGKQGAYVWIKGTFSIKCN